MFTLVAALQVAVYAQAPIRGFPPADLKEQHAREAKLRALPAAAHIRAYMKRMSAEPHHAGSAGSRAVAEYALGLFKEWGLDAHIETFEGLMPYPRTRIVEMVEPVRFRAQASEWTEPASEALPTYNAYSPDGDVTAPLLYVNYGALEDYDHLARAGISARGKIVIARYGRIWRGAKVKIAAEQGATACILYSDPRDDGYFQGDVYPSGPYRPAQGVQRGSVLDMPFFVGDPLSPGWASESGGRRLALNEAVGLPAIPVMPLSYEDASSLLRQLAGPVAPESWRGALGFTYHIGPGPAKIRLNVTSDWATRPVHNVIATIPGSEFPDQWILYGNHHDAWVHGANDPGSGASALLESARALGELRKSGWQPKRTILFALWDGEEFGLIGSTEWVEKHQAELDRKLVAYLNSDTNGKGRISAGGSHSLEVFVAELLRTFHDPEKGTPLIEGRLGGRARAARRDTFHLAALGAGSDYVPFLAHTGIASLNLGFGAEGSGVYHSAFDTFDWYSRFSDSDFVYGRTFSAITATLLLRLSDAPLLPFEFVVPAETIKKYVHEIAREAGRDQVPWRDLEAELGRLALSARTFEDDYHAALRRWQRPPLDQLAEINRALFRTERAWLSAAGLPGREWYKHQIYAPGRYSGYAAETLPAIRECLESGQIGKVKRALDEVLGALRTLHTEVTRIGTLLRELQGDGPPRFHFAR